jgi:hypothetical protein
MARINFASIFTKHPDGSLEPKQRIRVGGVEFGPGIRFNQGVLFAGIDFTLFEDRDFEVSTDKDILVIKGIY